MFLTAAEIKNKFNFSLADRTTDEPIEFAAESAASDLEDWLSAGDYAMAEGNAEPLEPLNLKKYKRIVKAHAYLTIYYVYLNNTQIRAAGNVTSERDENNAVTNSYLRPGELKTLREQYLEQAKNLIAGFSIVGFSGVIETSEFLPRETTRSIPVEYVW